MAYEQGEGILEARRRYEAEAINAAENGLPPLPPFEEWVKAQSLADVFNKSASVR